VEKLSRDVKDKKTDFVFLIWTICSYFCTKLSFLVKKSCKKYRFITNIIYYKSTSKSSILSKQKVFRSLTRWIFQLLWIFHCF